MRKIIVLFCFFLGVWAVLPAQQQGCRIRVNLKGYSYDTLWFGHTFGKRAVPEFFGLRQPDGSFELKNENPMPAGIYAIVYKRAANANYQFIQCLLADGQREFSIETVLGRPFDAPVISGSKENELLYDYLKKLEAYEFRLDSLQDAWRFAQDEPSFRQVAAAEEAIRQLQDEVVRDNPGTLTAGFIKDMLFYIPPATMGTSKGWQEDAAHRWHLQRQHYLDWLGTRASDFMRYPQRIEANDYFLFRQPPADPDTAKVLIDEILRRLESYPEAYEYYLKYLVNSLGRMSRFRLDEVFVYIIRNYVQAGKAPWTSPDEMQKMADEARRMEPLFVGKQAPNLKLFDRTEKQVILYEVQSPLTMLIFWMPDCSHCKKEIPLIRQVYEQHQNKDLKIITVCGKASADLPACWAFVDEQKFPLDWLTLSDPYRQSGMNSSYNLRSFPRIFLLDAEKKILFKKAGEMSQAELEAVLKKFSGQKR